MTHGRLVYIEPDGTIYVSSDFNGDMYYSEGSYGWRFADAFARMPSGLGPEELTKWLDELQSDIFRYDSNEIKFDKKIENLDFSGQEKYFDCWFSDYIYIRNDGECVNALDRDGKWLAIPHGVITVLDFGRYEINIMCQQQPTEDSVIDSTEATEEHRQQIARNIQDFCNKMSYRAAAHDLSKLVPPEKDGFDRSTLRLSDMTYNSEEYKRSLKEMASALEHHYANNDHHPEHFNNGIDGMNLYCLVEMYEDWKAAAKRTKNGNIINSVSENKGKFHIDDQLYSILMNTAVFDTEEEKRRK